jgi:FMN phosphatase YigB (HAD superfamily)
MLRTNKNIKQATIEILSQLELLKYIGGKDLKGLATGEGIPVDIVLLPDLVLDIRKYNLDIQNIDQKCIAIGGRAGRVACILGHLTEVYDDFYQPHLVAKTGNLGRLLIENEFYDKDHNLDSRKIQSHIIDSRREPRVTVWNDAKEDFDSRQTFAENEISVEDIEKNEILRKIINSSRVIYYSSIKSPNLGKLLPFIASEIKESATKLFLDCTRSTEDHLELLKQILMNEEFQGDQIEALILSESEQRLLLNKWPGYKADLARKYIGILQYSNKAIEYYDKNGALLCNISSLAQFDNEDIPERFKAGFILAKAVCETIKHIKDEITDDEEPFVNELINGFAGFWEHKPVEKMIYFGLTLASGGATKLGYCNLESLCGNWHDDVKEMFPGECNTSEPKTEIAYHTIKRLQINDDQQKKLILLAGLRRNSLLKDLKKTFRSHSSCSNSKECKYGQSQIGQVEHKYPKTALMIDLDGTLLDSETERKRALSKSLKIVNDALSAMNQKAYYDGSFCQFFEENIYRYWPFYEALGKGDFRKKWNIKGWYTVYIMLVLSPELLAHMKSDFERINKPDKHPVEVKRCVEKAELSWRPSFDSMYQDTENKYGDVVEKAMREFREVRLFAFKEAFDFLKSLKDSGLYNLYIVSEGDVEAQRLKLKSTGLAEFFPRARTLTTDDAANLNKQLSQLAQEKATINKLHSEAESEKKSLQESISNFAVFENIYKTSLEGIRIQGLACYSEITDSFEEYAGVFKNDNFVVENYKLNQEILQLKRQLHVVEFIEMLLHRLNTKGGVSFYAAVVRAILSNPEAPLDSLRDFEKLADLNLPASPNKFAMIGDRQENDIKPVIELMGRNRVLTIRMLSGKYYNIENYKSRVSANTDPDYIVFTLAQAKALLLSDAIWDDKICTYSMPFFCLKIKVEAENKSQRMDYRPSENDILSPGAVNVTVGLDIILDGIRISPVIAPLTNKICRQILKEFILLGAESDFESDVERFLEMIVSHQEVGSDNEETLRKARVISSVIIDTKMQAKTLVKYASKLSARLKDLDRYMRERIIDTSERASITEALKIMETYSGKL